MSPHVFFWPFDIGPTPYEKERTRATTHIPDWLRLGVLAQDEGAELRWQGHMMQCPLCHEPALSLWEQIPEAKDAAPFTQQVSCPQARNALFRYLEQGRQLEPAVINHLLACLTCSDHFLEPTRALYTLEIDEDAIAAQD